MNVKYCIHPGEYAVGENEKFYADQAAKGWFLEKRGTYFSKFRKGEPAQMKYRIELSAVQPFLTEAGEITLPEAQVALYEDCGWTLTAHRGMVHIFSAPENSGAPEFYSEPEQQAQTLKALRRGYRASWLIIAAMLGLLALLSLSLRSGEDVWGAMWADLVMKLIRTTAGFLFYFFWLGWCIYQLAYGGVRTRLLYCRLKRGEPLDHAPSVKHWGHRAATGFFAAGVVLSVLLLLVQMVGTKTRALPLESDGPYLLLADLGFDGARTEGFSDNELETSRSLAVSLWRTSEYVTSSRAEFSNWVHMDQHIYRLPTPGLAMAAAPAVMGASVFGYEFQQTEADGLDAAWYSDFEYVAVKGQWIFHICLIDSSGEAGAETVFRAIAERCAGRIV